MPTDDERRDVARRLRKTCVERYNSILSGIHLGESVGVCAQIVSPHEDQARAAADRLADLIDPSCDLGPSGWTSFDERLPELGTPVLCKGKNGAHYVGRPVTVNREYTCKVWVPRGGEYRSPAAWRPVDSPPCDREALLALADELEQETGSVCGVCMGKTARRIREACGEVSE